MAVPCPPGPETPLPYAGMLRALLDPSPFTFSQDWICSQATKYHLQALSLLQVCPQLQYLPLILHFVFNVLKNAQLIPRSFSVSTSESYHYPPSCKNLDIAPDLLPSLHLYIQLTSKSYQIHPHLSIPPKITLGQATIYHFLSELWKMHPNESPWFHCCPLSKLQPSFNSSILKLPQGFPNKFQMPYSQDPTQCGY